jgi:hypothetical protein
VAPGVNADPDVRGLALLVRKGMAAWMRGLSAPRSHPAISVQCNSSPAISTAAAAPPERCAAGIEQTLVNILAAMTQAYATEVCT